MAEGMIDGSFVCSGLTLLDGMSMFPSPGELWRNS